jgi:hypothetical protein
VASAGSVQFRESAAKVAPEAVVPEGGDGFKSQQKSTHKSDPSRSGTHFSKQPRAVMGCPRRTSHVPLAQVGHVDTGRLPSRTIHHGCKHHHPTTDHRRRLRGEDHSSGLHPWPGNVRWALPQRIRRGQLQPQALADCWPPNPQQPCLPRLRIPGPVPPTSLR